MNQQDLLTKMLEGVDFPENSGAYQKLQVALAELRERAGFLADEIARSSPNLTVHGATHIDALCQLAPRIAGQDFLSNPAEAFVLAASFCIHDLGNGLAAFTGGEGEVRETTEWKDIYSLAVRSRHGRPPKPEEFEAPDEEIATEILPAVLRCLHAQQAEKLATTALNHEGADHYLIGDRELRHHYGAIIGILAHSHHWDSDQLSLKVLPRRVTALPSMPPAWAVETMKLAILLRVTDAAHLDSRRAPSFLYAIRKPKRESDSHWRFQERLGQPIIRDGLIEFTSTRPFRANEAHSWFRCFDALRALDKELQDADMLLEAHRFPRLNARRVAGIHTPSTLAKHIKVGGWTPVDSPIRVSDVAALVKNIGGRALYGDDARVPLRELIQNAADAVRARRVLEERDSDWGQIVVTTGTDEYGVWVEVSDSGVGMSKRVVTCELLDFGKSLWQSDRLAEELPGLASTKYEATGNFGIGFFFVFLWGKRVRVTTRRYEEATSSTLVLEVLEGVGSRPLLRSATEEETLRDGGTTVRVWVDRRERLPFFKKEGKHHNALIAICGQVAPTLDVRLLAGREDCEASEVLAPRDWRTIGARTLQQRLEGVEEGEIKKIGSLPAVRDDAGRILGRVGVSTSVFRRGLLTVGGLQSDNVSGLQGVLLGRTFVAARDRAIPFATQRHFELWWREEKERVIGLPPEEQAQCAGYLASLGCDLSDIIIGKEGSKGWMTLEQLADCSQSSGQVLLVDRVAPDWFELEEYYRGFEQVGRPSLDTITVVVPSLFSRVRLGEREDRRGSRYLDPDVRSARSKWGNWDSLSQVVLRRLALSWDCEITEVSRLSEIGDSIDVDSPEEGLSFDCWATWICRPL